MSETDWDAEKGAIKPEFGQKYRDLSTRDAAERSRRATLPPTPNDYKLDLPKDVVVPQGVEFKINEESPIVPLARQLMHDIDQGKLSGQEAFSRLVAIHAAEQIGRAQSEKTFREAQVAQLGATGTQRVTAITDFAKGIFGDEALVKAMIPRTAEQVAGWEKLIARFTSQGAGSYSTTGSQPPPPKTEIPNYANMTFEQRRAAQVDAQRRGAA